jgi:hypothetical protein
MSGVNRLKREAGENPARSRHCKWEALSEYHWLKNTGKVEGCSEHEPGDLPDSALNPFG